jgi:hypothetical protein
MKAAFPACVLSDLVDVCLDYVDPTVAFYAVGIAHGAEPIVLSGRTEYGAAIAVWERRLRERYPLVDPGMAVEHCEHLYRPIGLFPDPTVFCENIGFLANRPQHFKRWGVALQNQLKYVLPAYRNRLPWPPWPAGSRDPGNRRYLGGDGINGLCNAPEHLLCVRTGDVYNWCNRVYLTRLKAPHPDPLPPANAAFDRALEAVRTQSLFLPILTWDSDVIDSRYQVMASPLAVL